MNAEMAEAKECTALYSLYMPGRLIGKRLLYF